MPELPEVETIRTQLARVLPGKVIKSVEVRLPKQVQGISVGKFKQQLIGSRVVGLERRAKMLVIEIFKERKNLRAKEHLTKSHTELGSVSNKKILKRVLDDSGRKYLVFHLKMTGQLIYQNPKSKIRNRKLFGGGHPIKGALEKLPNKYSHVIFNFRGGSKLYFNDLRQFGWVKLFQEDNDYFNYIASLRLGPEPTAPDFDFTSFLECMKARPKSRIYQAIMDQKCVVGVGNIYANESLFRAGIRPTRRNKNIKKQDYKKLYQGIKKILKKAIAVRGTTIGNYMDALGDFGNFSKYLKVYGREGKKCTRRGCFGIVERLKIGARSAFYCPTCQK